jgi:hypothetical protein
MQQELFDTPILCSAPVIMFFVYIRRFCVLLVGAWDMDAPRGFF